jgi:hypothetical protein
MTGVINDIGLNGIAGVTNIGKDDQGQQAMGDCHHGRVIAGRLRWRWRSRRII